MVCLYYLYVDFFISNVHHSFLFGSNPKRYVSLDKSLTFQIFLGIHPSKAGLKLVYYPLYYVESSFPIDLCPHPFKHIIQLFEFKLTIIYKYTTQRVLFLYTQNIVNRQYIFESTKIYNDTMKNLL